MRNVQSGRIVQNSMYLMSCMLITPTLPEVRITAQWQAARLRHWDNDSEQLLDKKFPTMTTGASSDIIDQIKEEQSRHHVAAQAEQAPRLYTWCICIKARPSKPKQATPLLHWLCICQNTHLFAKRESRVNAKLEKDPLKIYAIMCNMRRLNSHRELGKFLHAAAACCCRATLFALKQLHWMYGAYCATVKGGGIAAWGWRRRRHKLEQRSKVTSLLANRFYFLTSFFSVCKYSVRLGQNPCRWKDDECRQFVLSGLQNHLPISLNLSILTYCRFCPCRTCMCMVYTKSDDISTSLHTLKYTQTPTPELTENTQDLLGHNKCTLTYLLKMITSWV